MDTRLADKEEVITLTLGEINEIIAQELRKAAKIARASGNDSDRDRNLDPNLDPQDLTGVSYSYGFQDGVDTVADQLDAVASFFFEEK